MKALRKTWLAPVGTAKRVSKTRHPANVVAAGSCPQRNRLGTKRGADAVETFSNLVECLVPADTHPLARTAPTDARPWIFQTVWMIDEIHSNRPDWAQPAVDER